MKIFLFQAFASNNSGSYTIVGTFSNSATAESAANILTDVLAAHGVWHERAGNEKEVSPLDEFAEKYGLRDPARGRDQDWPDYGAGPSVVALDCQVLVHAPYTVTMPRAIGEFFYAQGGRVSVELDHAHDDIAVEFMYYAHYDDAFKKEKLDAFETRLSELLGPLTTRRERDQRPPIEPAWYRGSEGGRCLGVVFRDLAEGTAAFGQLAKEMEVHYRIDVRECPSHGRDPFASMRESLIPQGSSGIILWQVGERIAAMKAVREVLGCGLEQAKQAIANLPSEIIVDVDAAYARKCCETLIHAGCDAEVFVPARHER